MERIDELLFKKSRDTITKEELGELVDLLIFEGNSLEFEEDTKSYLFKCKPCYQFQSIEFEVEADKHHIGEVVDLYALVLEELMRITPEQNKVIPNKAVLATEKQKEIMRKFGISYTASTTQAEAQELIKESIANSQK